MPICGGNWNNGSNAGVFNVNLNNPRSISNSNVGFRSALPSNVRSSTLMGVVPVQRG
nr:MAG TPA: TREPONEMA DENTICOLA VARIABLE PROTEIN 1 FUNCTION, PERIODONTAL DISEASE [Caudoviricetes sp.]